MRILAVAVTYHPDADLLTEALRSVAPQVQGVVIVDNGSRNADEVCSIAASLDAQVLTNARNVGIAAAQNQGIDFALANGFSHVLLLGQDTLLSPGVVADLARQLAALQADRGGVAAVGPAYFEVHSGQQTRAYRSQGWRISRVPLGSETKPVASDSIIASGSLIPLDVLKEVGRFKEELFIDLVDVEWCFRAQAAGYTAYISPTAIVHHHLGSGTVRIGPRQIALHIPIRNYYWVRNALWLARQPYTPRAWRLYFISRSLAFLAAYTTVADKRLLRLQMICRGIRDSLRGQFGPFEFRKY